MDISLSFLKASILPILLLAMSMPALSIENSHKEWVCEKVASQKTGSRYLICGVAISISESLARQTALENAYLEFDKLCSRTYSCKGREIETTPHRNECYKVSDGYRCIRSLTVDVLEEEKSDMDKELAEADDYLALKKKEYYKAKLLESKRRKAIELDKKIENKEFESSDETISGVPIGKITKKPSKVSLSIGLNYQFIEANSASYSNTQSRQTMLGYSVQARYDLADSFSPYFRHARSSVNEDGLTGNSINASQSVIELGFNYHPFTKRKGIHLIAGYNILNYEINETVDASPEIESSGVKHGFTYGIGFRFINPKNDVIGDVNLITESGESVGFGSFSLNIMMGVPF